MTTRLSILNSGAQRGRIGLQQVVARGGADELRVPKQRTAVLTHREPFLPVRLRRTARDTREARQAAGAMHEVAGEAARVGGDLADGVEARRAAVVADDVALAAVPGLASLPDGLTKNSAAGNGVNAASSRAERKKRQKDGRPKIRTPDLE